MVLPALVLLAVAAPLRVAVLVEDPHPTQPVRAALEARFQEEGLWVVDAEASERLRTQVLPGALQDEWPEGATTFDADLMLAGAVTYGAPVAVGDAGVQSQSVQVTLRWVEPSRARVGRTEQTHGVGLGVHEGPRLARAALQAVSRVFSSNEWMRIHREIGPRQSSVMLIVRDVQDRKAVQALTEGLETAFLGAPVTERSWRLGVLQLQMGDGSARTLVGTDVADLIEAHPELGLEVTAVANARIEARRTSAGWIRALVLEPQGFEGSQGEALGRYLATQLAEAGTRVDFQAGSWPRKEALRWAREHGVPWLVEAEKIDVEGRAAFALRFVDVQTGLPAWRAQQVIGDGGALEVAQALLSRAVPPAPDGAAESEARADR